MLYSAEQASGDLTSRDVDRLAKRITDEVRKRVEENAMKESFRRAPNEVCQTFMQREFEAIKSDIKTLHKRLMSLGYKTDSYAASGYSEAAWVVKVSWT